MMLFFDPFYSYCSEKESDIITNVMLKVLNFDNCYNNAIFTNSCVAQFDRDFLWPDEV